MTFQKDSFIYSLSQFASQCLGQKGRRRKKGAFYSGEAAGIHTSRVICILLETFSPELRKKDYIYYDGVRDLTGSGLPALSTNPLSTSKGPLINADPFSPKC